MKQKKVIRFANGEGATSLSVGVIRSGKTFAAVAGFFAYSQKQPESRRHIISGHKLRVIEAEILPQIKTMARAFGVSYNYTMSHQFLQCGKQKYHLYAGNDNRSLGRVLGLTVHSALVDEATLVPENFFQAIVTRLSFADSKLWATCNPSFPLHWLKRDWLDKDKLDQHLQFEFVDNPVLSPAVIKRNKELFSGVFKRRMVEGLWAAAEGLIFPDYTVRELDVSEHRVLRTIVAVDYGVASVTSFVKIHKLKKATEPAFYYIPRVKHIVGGSDLQKQDG